MGILRLTKPVDPNFECEALDPELKKVKADIILVRPCERYQELYKSCKSIRGRLHQYYVYGELFDCTQHYERFLACKKFRETKDIAFLDPVIQWEKTLISERLQRAESNPVWQYRTSPPADFEGPLPEFIRKKQDRSIFTGQSG